MLGSKVKALAAVLERDILEVRTKPKLNPFAECFSCGRGMTTVILTWHEVRRAIDVAVSRHLEALAAGRRNVAGLEGHGWDEHILGAIGEIAVAKCVGVYWDGGVNTFKNGGDVGALQVRTRSKHEWDLIVRNNDRDEDRFVLVTLDPADLLHPRIHGWLHGREAKKSDYLRDYAGRPPAYFVPQSDLRAIDSLNPVASITEAPGHAVD